MMVLPLPSFSLDLLFTFNIAMAMMVMMVSRQPGAPLDFAAFPTVLLITTLLRLSLNVAHPPAWCCWKATPGPGAAGHVIESFGHFLIGGNFAVGLIVFAILVVINFIVVTKGAGAHRRGRRALHPGRDARQADGDRRRPERRTDRRRRGQAPASHRVGDEAEFFGSMDGASKFVRGDAMAGILILFINIIGGFIVGVVQHDLSAGDAAAELHPAGRRRRAGRADPGAADLGGRRHGRQPRRQGRTSARRSAQLFGSPQGAGHHRRHPGPLGLVPGMPHSPSCASSCCGRRAGASRNRRPRRRQAKETSRCGADAKPADVEAGWDDVTPVDVLGLEVGYRLIALVDNQDGDLLKRIKGVRRSSRRTSASCRRRCTSATTSS
jgi:flagellar biosynthesis protein FlhA